MNPELTAIKDAMDAADFETARDLATLYVQDHPAEFGDYEAIVRDAPDESTAVANIVSAIEALRAAGLTAQQYRAEAFHLFRWNPQNINGTTEPTVRNDLPASS